jgi:NADH-quinone oxidoreductase subunit C
MATRIETLASTVAARFGDRLKPVESHTREVTFELADAAELATICTALRDEPELAFEQLIDASGVDYLDYGRSEWRTSSATRSGFSRGVARGAQAEYDAGDPGQRFAVVYHLLSVTHNWRLRLRVWCSEGEPPIVGSVTGIWPSANWYEREAFDLFGILFRGHPDLRRILTDYGFIGHPFRKDFPLIGTVEVRYDPARARVVYQPVTIEPRTLVPRVIRDDNRYEEELKGPVPNG